MAQAAFELTGFHHEVQARLQKLDASLPGNALSDDVRRSLYKYALIRNSWGTTNIDAGPITIKRVQDLYDAYKHGVTKGGKILPTEREVINYFELVDDLPTAPFPLSVDDVQELHRLYFREVKLDNNAKPGQWKQQDVVIEGPYGVVKTTPKDKCVEELREATEWLNGPAQGLPLYVRTALLFHRFQAIHPFADGNGRAGRLLALTVLSSGGLNSIRYCPIDDEINLHRQDYYAALNAADLGNHERWVSYFGAELLSGYQRAHVLGERLQRIPPAVPLESRNLLEYAYVHRLESFKVNDIASFYLGLHKNTITKRLAELEDLGLIRGNGRGAGRSYSVKSLHEVKSG
jgi:Fic family protein